MVDARFRSKIGFHLRPYCLCPHACAAQTLIDRRPSPISKRGPRPPVPSDPFWTLQRSRMYQGQMSDIPEIGGVKKGANDNSETLWGQAVAYYTTFWESLEFTIQFDYFSIIYTLSQLTVLSKTAARPSKTVRLWRGWLQIAFKEIFLINVFIPLTWLSPERPRSSKSGAVQVVLGCTVCAKVHV